MKTFKDKLKEIALNPLVREQDIPYITLMLVYDEYKEDTMKLFLSLQQRERDDMKHREQELRIGLDTSVSAMSIMSKQLIETNNKAKAKQIAEMYLDTDNLTFSLPVIKAAFPNGNCKNGSGAEQWIFNRFVALLKQHKEKYLKGGDSYNWAQIHKYSDYIQLVLNQLGDE